MDAFAALYRSMSAKRRRHLVLTMLVMLAGAFAEMLTIGAALPFLALVASEPGQQGPAHALMLGLGFESEGIVLAAAMLLASAAVAAALVRLLLLWMIQRFVEAVGHDLSTNIFGRMLRQPYDLYVRQNSSELLAGMEKIRSVVFGMVQPAMQGIVAACIAIFVGTLLFIIDPYTTLLAAACVAAVYAALTLFTYRRLRRNSVALAQAATARTKIIQEGLGGIRDILLDRSQPHFEARFGTIDSRYRHAYAANAFMAAAPRFVVEAAGIVAIAFVAYIMSRQPGGIVEAIPVLGALALGAQRLLPLLQQAYSGWSQTAGNLHALTEVVALMETTAACGSDVGADAPPTPFCRDIVFDAVSFRYGSGDIVLHDVDLTIRKGARIGIGGRTGSGKTSLLDLLMGLLEPTGGEIRIDGHKLDDVSRGSWQAQLAHIPQTVYLVDATIEANIAFGAEDPVDRQRIEAAARAAHLHHFVQELPAGYDTVVGERGIRLSGGQRQRIGIARALYKRASVLVLDEATNALDEETEAAIMTSVMNLDPGMTIIIVSHRRSTLAGCSRILTVAAGTLVEIDAELPETRREGAASLPM